MTNEQRNKLRVNAVGSVGKDNPKGLTLKHYWTGYDKFKSPKSVKSTKLIHIVKKCSEQRDGNVVSNYDLLIRGVIDFLRKANKKYTNQEGDAVYYNKTLLLKELQTNDNSENFKSLLAIWLLSDFPDQATWNTQVSRLKSLFSLNTTLDSIAQDYVAYDSFSPIETPVQQEKIATNVYKCSNGIEIEVATIHAVKGENHDATLILETKFNYFFDLKSLLDYFIDDNKDRPIGNHDSPRSKPSLEAAFLKRLYVAASRPRHLLCLAINKDHISTEQREELIKKGWEFCDLTTKADVSAASPQTPQQKRLL